MVDHDLRNLDILTMIELAAFMLCLDEETPKALEERSRNFWHGSGSNRWFDKTAVFILCDNGVCGYMGEHSMVDGMQALRMVNFISQMLHEACLDIENLDVRNHLPQPKRYDFVPGPDIFPQISQAVKNFRRTINSHEISVLSYDHYGSGYIKRLTFAPDSWVQMLIQLAYYQFSGTFAPTYEAQSTRVCFRGRTEAIRSLSMESVAFCKAMDAPNNSAAKKIRLFRDACRAHFERSVAAAKGAGIDRHLSGLSKMLRPNEDLPDLFRDSFYQSSQHWIVCTSQASGEHLNAYGWAQVVDDGFGIAYMVLKNRFGLPFNFKIGVAADHQLDFSSILPARNWEAKTSRNIFAQLRIN